MRCKRIAGITLLMVGCIFCLSATGQKLSFQNYGVDKGLIQSQVQAITQDSQSHLWVGTFAGLDRFDGINFRHYNKADGLASNSVTALCTDRSGNVWIATFRGISCYDGKRFINYPVVDKSVAFNFSKLISDQAGRIWAFQYGQGLYYLKDSQFVIAPKPYPGAVATCIQQDPGGNLAVSFDQQGIYTFELDGWKKKKMPKPFLTENEIIVYFDELGGFEYYVTNHKKILKYSDQSLLKRGVLNTPAISGVTMDRDSNFWIGTVNGAVVYNRDFKELFRCNAATGFTDNFISEMYNDKQGNLWIGSDGDGLYSFSSPLFLKHDKGTGLPGNVVMGLCSVGADMFIATREAGLIKYNTTSKKHVRVDYSSFSRYGVNCIGKTANAIYFCTMDNKLIRYDKNGLRVIRNSRPLSFFVNTITEMPEGVWLSTDMGLCEIKNDSICKIPGIDEITGGVISIGNDERLIATAGGLYHYQKGRRPQKVGQPQLANADILCLKRFKNFAILGTTDNGLLYWELGTDQVYSCNKSDGLLDNQVFSIFEDKAGNIWVGTGTGAQLVSFDEKTRSFKVRRFSRAHGYESAETNLNAIAQDAEGAIWIGTTKGAFVYSDRGTPPGLTRPYVLISQVESPGLKQDSTTLPPWQAHRVSATLDYQHNNISFSVKAVLLSNPEQVRYLTKLEGYDDDFSAPLTQSYFNYQNLEPGRYIFKVKAITTDSTLSENIAEFPFYVQSPFHKTIWFYLLIAFALISLGVGMQVFFSQLKRKREAEMYRIKQTEQEKIRKQTAEDFHDELGNKLTRIALLAEILEKKSDSINITERADIISQIRENVSGLYSGTKEVIWSLNPGSNRLLDLVKHIREFGNELFNSTSINFHCMIDENSFNGIELPIEHSRNLSMIAKEALHNILRHSFCTEAAVACQMVQERAVQFVFTDNGRGYDTSQIKKGNGMANIQQRASRINAEFNAESAIEKGTILTIKFKIPPNAGRTA
ncbi:MAG: two-component regulator propeller domain-containing protein [Chitinophagaceae bacterium]